MPRALHYCVPGLVWHIAHHCPRKEFRLQLACDRLRSLRRVFAAKKRFGLSVLDSVITANPARLLIMDNGGVVIDRAGRTRPS